MTASHRNTNPDKKLATELSDLLKDDQPTQYTLVKATVAPESRHQLKKEDTQSAPKISEETGTIADMKRRVQITPNGSPNPSRHGG
ncbi:MAG: hypothetical protein SH821_01345 [Phototrophicales bacterium]|nr:hypothetical protein [Phototrophicales bacterium]